MPPREAVQRRQLRAPRHPAPPRRTAARTARTWAEAPVRVRARAVRPTLRRAISDGRGVGRPTGRPAPLSGFGCASVEPAGQPENGLAEAVEAGADAQQVDGREDALRPPVDVGLRI